MSYEGEEDTYESDVYAFGVTLWEVMTRQYTLATTLN